MPAPTSRQRLSVSLPAWLAQWARRQARDRKTTISAVVAKAIEKLRDQEKPR